jgi:sulfite oxidase
MSKKPGRDEMTRRSFLAAASQVGAILGLGHYLPPSLSVFAQTPAVIKGKERLIVRSLRPEDLETPVGLLNSFITPNDLFYVRHHMYAPETREQGWKIDVSGEVDRPGSMTLEELKRLPRATTTVTLECAGNGRAFFEPSVAGIQWEKGAVGTARFTGARLSDVLKNFGLKSTARYIVMNGADVPVGKMPDFIRNVPLEKGLHADTIIAYEMNGSPIPQLHGFPLRAIIPGWEGAYSVKWVNRIEVLDREHDGFFVKTAYRYPTKRVAPGAAVDAKDMAPLTGLVIKSLITAPIDGTTAKVGTVRLSGFAWAGENDVVRVDVSLDNGATWHQAELGRERERYTWRGFTYDFKIGAAGSYTLMARAADNKGNIQPIEAMWNPSGYLWNVIDRVRINVEA